MSNARDNIFLALLAVVVAIVCALIYFYDTKPTQERCEKLGGEMVYTPTTKTQVCEAPIGSFFKAER